MILPEQKRQRIKYRRQKYNSYKQLYDAFGVINEALQTMSLPDINYIDPNIEFLKLTKSKNWNGKIEGLYLTFKVKNFSSGWGNSHNNYIRIWFRCTTKYEDIVKNLRANKLSSEVNTILFENFTRVEYQMKNNDWDSNYRTIYYGNDFESYNPEKYKPEWKNEADERYDCVRY